MGNVSPLVWTLAAADTSPLLLELVIILVTAGVVSLVFQRLRLAAIPAYLVAGALIGPGLTGIIPTDEHVASISQLAIVLLMFGIGLHMDPGSLRGGFRSIIGVGTVACLVLTALGTAIAMAFGQPAPAALLISAGISMSSTAAVMRILQQRRQLRDLHGRIAFGTLIVQDLFAVVTLAMVPVLIVWADLQRGVEASGDEGPGVVGVIATMSLGVGGLATIVVAGRLLLPRLLEAAARGASSELVLIIGAAAGLGSAALTAALGLSAELGAFLAGFLLAATPVRHQLMGQLAPVRDLFIPVFFVSVGLSLNLAAAWEMWWVVLVVFALVMVLKAVVISTSAWAFGFSAPVAVMAGLALAQAGEFTLLTVSVGAGRGLISDQALAVVSAVVALTLIVTPSLIQVSPRLAELFVKTPAPPWVHRQLRDISARKSKADPEHLHAIIAGFGPVGRELFSRLELAGFSVSIIELNPDTVSRQRDLGRRVFYGDAANPEVLHEAGVHHADVVLLTMPDHEAMLNATRLVREAAPEAFIATRSGYLSRGMQASMLGADYVAIDEVAAATVMAKEVCERMDSRLAQRRAESQGASSADALPPSAAKD